MIKKILIAIMLFTSTTTLDAQNLVPNPSFEELSRLPKKLEVYNYEFESMSSNKGFNQNLNFWFSGNINSPDLRILNKEYIGRSKSKYGKYYSPRTGINVMGIVIYMKNKEGTNFREYIQIKLKKSLIKGTKTYVEFWVLLDRQSKLASNNIGCYFSTKKIYSINDEPIIVAPQINEDSIILGDRFEWKKVSGSFITEEAYNFITIGNFFSEEKTNLKEILFFRGEPFIDPTAYYLIDDVRVWQEESKEKGTFKEKEIKVGEIITLENVEFDSNSAALKESSFVELNELINLMEELKGIKIGIYGHTDNVGSKDSNLKLSNDRAVSIYNYLLEKGIEKQRMFHKGFGENNPIQDNSEEMGRKKNRRVEFIVISKE